jgi:parvulin-like peptidyl-prolyl isomerase
MLRILLREPLVHFLGLALLIFVAYGALNRDLPTSPSRVVVTQSTVEQMTTLFARTWQRPPSHTELKGLIDDYVKEEIYYREALALGLDTNDTVIRRRLRQKMEFLSDAEVDAVNPTDAELEHYLQAHPSKFAIDSKISIRQIFLSSEKRGDKAGEEATSILTALRSDSSLDSTSLGDPTLLPSELTAASQSGIGSTFGAEFAEAVAQATPGTWFGPVRSSFGVHLVRVTEVKVGRAPALAEVREAVAREWTFEKRKALADQRFAKLLKHYQVTVESPPPSSAQALAGP